MLLKKQVDKSAIEKVEAEIGRLQQIISDRKLPSKGSKEGVEAAIRIFKSYRGNCITLQKQCYFQTNHAKMLRTLEYAGEITALDFVISLFEDPDATTIVHQDQLTKLERQLVELRKMPLRPED